VDLSVIGTKNDDGSFRTIGRQGPIAVGIDLWKIWTSPRHDIEPEGTLNELQEVFDTDLITICEGMGLLDSNQADRLKQVDFQYRNHSAHPGQAPIEDPHLVAFFTDINEIILTNPKFAI
jgi:hypothetical protein